MRDWTGRLVDDPYHPWCDVPSHTEGRRIAHIIASDLVKHRRWDSGANDPIPAYDPVDGHYVGDAAVDDSVRCQAHLLQIRQRSWWELVAGAASTYDLTRRMCEVAYRAYFADALQRTARLRDQLDTMLAGGQLQHDEHRWTVLRRLVARGYTAEALRAEVTTLTTGPGCQVEAKER